MADVFTVEKRSAIMRRIKGRDTGPERVVRSLVHRLGLRFRLHRSDLPGKPDIVLSRHKKVVFVHGCFWHCHPKCLRATKPHTNVAFWETKLAKNRRRDARVLRELKREGWTPYIVWECETRRPDQLSGKLRSLFR